MAGLGPDADAEGGLAGTVRGLGEAQLSLAGDVDELKRRVAELPGAVEALQKVQEQVHTLLGREATAVPPRTCWTDSPLSTTSEPLWARWSRT